MRDLAVPMAPIVETKGTKGDEPRRTDGSFSDIYLNYLVGQILIGGSRKRGTSRLFPSVAFIALLSCVGLNSNRSPGWHCSASQMASSVENRTARAFPGGWPRLNSEKRLWVAHPFGVGL